MKKILFSISLALVCVISILCCKNTSALRYENNDDLGYYFIYNDNEDFGKYDADEEFYMTEEGQGLTLIIGFANNSQYFPYNSYAIVPLNRFQVPNDTSVYGKYANKYIYYYNVEHNLVYDNFYYYRYWLACGYYVYDFDDTSQSFFEVSGCFENITKQLTADKPFLDNVSLDYFENSIFNNGYISYISNEHVYFTNSQPSVRYNFNVQNELLPQFIVDYFYQNVYGSLGASRNIENDYFLTSAYNSGYNTGYQKGLTDFVGTPQYDSMSRSYYNMGYEAGLLADDSNWLGVGLLSLVDIPVMLFSKLFNYDIFGFNFYYIFLGLITLGVLLWLIKKFFNKDS